MSEQIGKTTVKREGDTIRFFTTIGFFPSIQAVEVSELLHKMQEKLILEKLTDEEFRRFKKVVDSEYKMRGMHVGTN